jgi:hypothetical protein
LTCSGRLRDTPSHRLVGAGGNGPAKMGGRMTRRPRPMVALRRLPCPIAQCLFEFLPFALPPGSP